MDLTRYSKQFINGEWREGTGQDIMENFDPYKRTLINTYRAASLQDMNEAYEAAAIAQKKWWKTTQREKSEKLEKLYQVLVSRKDDIYEILRTECGSVDMKSGAEYYGTLDHIRQSISFPYKMDGTIMRSDTPQERMNYIFRKPKGVIGVIAPWNFPFLLAMRSVAPAIATGNAIVLRPSSFTPNSAFFIAEIFEEAGFPKGLINVISGPSSEIGDAFVEHPLANLISFTGSTDVGRHIGALCGGLLKDLSLELGGNNSLSILLDADLLQAAKAAVWGAYCHGGQICMAVNRILVHKDVYDDFIPLVVEEAKK